MLHLFNISDSQPSCATSAVLSTRTFTVAKIRFVIMIYAAAVFFVIVHLKLTYSNALFAVVAYALQIAMRPLYSYLSRLVPRSRSLMSDDDSFVFAVELRLLSTYKVLQV